MNINKNGCKINSNKSDNNNNFDIESSISNNFNNKYYSNIKGNNVYNKVRDTNSAKMPVVPTPVSVTSLTKTRKSTSTVMMVVKASATIT